MDYYTRDPSKPFLHSIRRFGPSAKKDDWTEADDERTVTDAYETFHQKNQRGLAFTIVHSLKILCSPEIFSARLSRVEAEKDQESTVRGSIETLFNNFLRMPWEMLLPPGYTSNASLKATMKLRASSLGSQAGRQTIEQLVASGTIVVGSPATVRGQIERVRDQTGFDILIALLQFGVMSDELARRNMELFAGEVMPKLR